jgi:hypothetical protein
VEYRVTGVPVGTPPPAGAGVLYIGGIWTMDMEVRFAISWLVFWALFVFVVVFGLVYAAYNGDVEQTWKFFGDAIRIIAEMF